MYIMNMLSIDQAAHGRPSDSSGGSKDEFQDYSFEAAVLESQQQRSSHVAPGAHEPFPVLLHWMLEQTEKEELSHIVSWLPHGRAFIVHHRDLFVQNVLPQ